MKKSKYFIGIQKIKKIKFKIWCMIFLIYDFICFEERLMKNDYSI